MLKKYQLEGEDTITCLFHPGNIGFKVGVGEGAEGTGARVAEVTSKKSSINYNPDLQEGMWVVMVDADDIPSMRFKTVKMLLRLKKSKRKKIVFASKRPEKMLTAMERRKLEVRCFGR